MSKLHWVLWMPTVACLIVGGLLGCGGASRDVVARVGGTPITKSEVGHWMSTLVGGDYYESSHRHRVPAGLVSEPANFDRCVASLTASAQKAPGAPKPSASQLRSKCEDLYQRLKEQAVAYLVEADWIIGLAHELGVSAGSAETKQMYDSIRSEFLNERRFQQYLASNRRTLADEMFVIKLDVLRQKLSEKLNAGGQRAEAKLVADGQRWTARTSCQAGYVVAHCRQYRSAPSPTPSPAVLLEQVATLVGDTPCVNKPACQ